MSPARRRGRRRRRKLTAVLGVAAAVLLTAVGVLAYLTSGGSGTASAAVGTLAEPEVTATSPSAGQAEIAWTAVPAPTGTDDEITFTVERTPSSSAAWEHVCGTGSVPKAYDELSCSDTPPGDEEYVYRVTAAFRTWTSSGEDTVYVAGTSAPYVLSIALVDPSPTNASSVRWAVTFSEAVIGVDAGDFVLAGSGAAGASVTGVSGGGDAYTVTADTGADGVLGLDLVDDDSIEDLAGNPLGGSGAGNGDFEGDSYLVDRTAPTVSSIVRAGVSPTNAGPLVWTVTFSEPVSGVDAADFGLVSSGITGTPAITSAAPSGSVPTATWTVSASMAGVAGADDGSIRLDQTGAGVITDEAGNALAGTFSGQAYAFDTTSPYVSSITRAGTSPTNAGPLVWTVTFSEPVSGVDATDFGLVSSGITGTPTITSASPSGPQPTATWAVSASVTGVEGTNSGSIRLDLTGTGVITDAAANPLAGTFEGQAYGFDTTGPSLASLVMLDVDEDGKVDRVEATFDEPLGAYGAGTAPWALTSVPSGGTLSGVTVSGAVATLAVAEGAGAPSTAVGSFTVAMAAAANGIRDEAGNEAPAFGATAPADGAAPVALDVQAVNGTGTAGRIDSGDVITYTFSEPMLASSILAGWSGASTTVTVEIANGSTDTVSVSGVNLGAIDTGGNYVRSTRTVNASMALSGTTVTVTLTATPPPGQLFTVASSTLTWTPSSAATDPAGNAMVATSRTQSGAPKRNF